MNPVLNFIVRFECYCRAVVSVEEGDREGSSSEEHNTEGNTTGGFSFPNRVCQIQRKLPPKS